MTLCILFLIEIVFVAGTYGVSYYTTPASDNEFTNFLITNAIPELGSTMADDDMQEPVLINGDFVIFEFKGLGNALISFQQQTVESLNVVFMVEIGGGTNYSRVGIRRTSDTNRQRNLLTSVTVPNITSAHEYRYFWISWITTERSIHVGTGHEIYNNEILTANEAVLDDVNLDKISNISISTTSSNEGYWRFSNTAMETTTKSLSNIQTTSDIEQTLTTSPRRATSHTGISTTEYSAKMITLITNQDYYETQERFTDKPESIAAIGVVGSVAGLGAVAIVGFLLKKRCTEVNTTSASSEDDDEENNRDPRNYAA